MSYIEKSYEALGRLVALTTHYHDFLVIALSRELGVALDYAHIVFAPRATGDLSATLKALLKFKAETVDTSIPISQILQRMDAVNKLVSRTNHVHGSMFTGAGDNVDPETGSPSIKFVRSDIGGGRYRTVKKHYETAEEFLNAVSDAKQSFHRLLDLFKITDEDFIQFERLRTERLLA